MEDKSPTDEGFQFTSFNEFYEGLVTGGSPVLEDHVDEPMDPTFTADTQIVNSLYDDTFDLFVGNSLLKYLGTYMKGCVCVLVTGELCKEHLLVSMTIVQYQIQEWNLLKGFQPPPSPPPSATSLLPYPAKVFRFSGDVKLAGKVTVDEVASAGIRSDDVDELVVTRCKSAGALPLCFTNRSIVIEILKKQHHVSMEDLPGETEDCLKWVAPVGKGWWWLTAVVDVGGAGGEGDRAEVGKKKGGVGKKKGLGND
ncbi:hypothetical protein E3N88_16301 [Mikania micrantha]|uniref:Uncharacterized protein n=1 Tax=Mikania micrantha TaxID=192012 RepID=A0A5N6NZR2_9ASTR|nr:hypothetical protein E3N88_16301 [Mikania micrantha]